MVSCEYDDALKPSLLLIFKLTIYLDAPGNASDDDIERCIKQRQTPPIRNSPITAHLSPSAIDLIEKCMQWDPKDRISAMELLEHPWVRGLTASEDKMTDASLPNPRLVPAQQPKKTV